MGRILLDHKLKISRNGLVMRRSDILPIGYVERRQLIWIWSCHNCSERHPSETQAVAGNDLFTHWTRKHGSAEPVHWAGESGEGPTSLHGNGASSFARTSGDEDEVTCKLCLTLLVRESEGRGA